MTVDEFLAWDPGDGRPWQLIDGVPVAMAPTTVTHGILLGRLSFRLQAHLEATGRSCNVVVAPGVTSRVHSRHNARIPDLAVSCVPSATGERLLREPVLLVEVLSPSDRDETWSNIWTHTTIPSVLDILILDGEAVRAEVLNRLDDGSWPEEPALLSDGGLVSASLDFRLRLADLYRPTGLLP